jgi:hypothetical protein
MGPTNSFARRHDRLEKSVRTDVRTAVVSFHARRRWQAHVFLVAADSMLESLPRGLFAFRIDVADWTKFPQSFRGWLSGRVDSAIHDLRASSNFHPLIDRGAMSVLLSTSNAAQRRNGCRFESVRAAPPSVNGE